MIRKLLPIIFCCCFFQSLQAQPKLKVYIVSHNEDNIGYLNFPGGRNNYLSARSALIALANMVQAKNLKYNYGADHVALRAIAQYDTGTVIANTSNKNLVKWMKEDRGVECDAHSHETTYNYADVAYFVSQLGITPTLTMSGFLYNQLQHGHSWENYQGGVTGDSFPSFTWYPEILWGAGSPSHINDPQYFGVYRPMSMANFTVHEPANHLILCGTGCSLKLTDTSTVAYVFGKIKDEADAIANGTLPQNGIYQQEIFFSEGNVDDPWFYPLVDQLTDSIATLVAAGKVEWQSISEITDEWKNTFLNQPFAMDCAFNILLQPSGIADMSVATPNIRVFPNPSDGKELHIISDHFVPGMHLQITDVMGKLIMTAELSEQETVIDVSSLSRGVYIISDGNDVLKWIR